MKKILIWAAMLLYSAGAIADSIAPTTFSATLKVGESTTLRKVVTVEDQSTTALIDVMFVLDNTGSMGAPLASLRANIDAAMTQTATLGDVRWGVGKFEDVYDPAHSWGISSDTPWTLIQQPTNDQALVGTAVAFPIGNGYDWEEGNLIALSNAATQVNWRPGSARFIVYLTDAPGHDPSTTPGYPGPTLQATIDALVAANIKVLAFVYPDDPQHDAIVNATGGHLDNLGLLNWGDRVAANVTTAVATYNTVTLGLNNPAGVDVTAVPVNHPTGPYDRSVTRTFEFDVTFTGVTPGTYNFTIDGLVDGGVVATETDAIQVIGPVAITTTSLPDATQGQPYTTPVNAAGGTSPYTWSATGLPPGLVMDPTTGVISGTTTSSGPFPVVVTVTDQAGQTHTSTLILTVNGPVVATVQPVPGLNPIGLGLLAALAAAFGMRRRVRN